MQTEEFLSKKIIEIASRPKKRGMYTIDDALEKGLGLATSKVRDIKLYLLVNVETDIIYDVKFFSYGKKLSVAIAEKLSEVVMNRNVSDLRDISGEEIEIMLRDDPSVPSVSTEDFEKFGIVEELIKIIISEYNMVKIKTVEIREEQKVLAVDLEKQDAEWQAILEEEKLRRIEAVLDEKVRAGLQMDGGNCTIEELRDGKNLFISYQGNCGSCGASSGGTLFFIEDTLRKNVYHGISVQPV